MLTERREKFKRLETKVGEFFSKVGLTPNQYTLISLIFAFLCFYFLAIKSLVLATIFSFIAIFLDLIDGAVAKFSKLETKKGAYLDTICDRYVEGFILLGFLFLPLPYFLLPSQVWIFLFFFGSLMTTYAKAAAKEKELVEAEFKKGLFGRPERVILMFLAILLGIFNLSLTLYLIVVLAILTNLTAFQRIYLTFNSR